MVDVCTPEELNVTYEMGVLEELQTVFNPEMAHASYIPFYCLIGRSNTIIQICSLVGITKTMPAFLTGNICI